MGMLAKRLLQTGAAFITLLASPVMAADMSVKTSLPPPAAPAFSWTGVYFGLNAGWLGANNALVNQTTPGVDPGVDVQGLAALASGDFSLGNKSGFIGGAEIGYNYQFSNWVAGIEADIQGIAGQAVNGSITSTSSTLSSALDPWIRGGSARFVDALACFQPRQSSSTAPADWHTARSKQRRR